MSVKPADIIQAARLLDTGTLYRWWYTGASLPMWLDDGYGWYGYSDCPPVSHVQSTGVMCSDLINFALQWNNLPAVGGTAAWASAVEDWDYFDVNAAKQPGMIAVKGYASDWAQGHIALYVSEHQLIQSINYPGVTAAYDDYTTYQWAQCDFDYMGYIPGVDYSGSGGDGGKVSDPDVYPGDCADPVPVARWMAHIAKSEYGIPGILPVMTSCVEMTAAWTGPGCVYNIPGYSYAVDHDSLGYFQQRPSMGWGTPAQLQDADYALRAFLNEAVKYKGDYDENDPYSLGEWCQAVQRSGVPDAYYNKGYPMAKELLKGVEEPDVPVPPSPPEKSKRTNYFSVNKDGVLVMGGEDWSNGWVYASSDDIEAGKPTPLLYVPEFQGEPAVDPANGAAASGDEVIEFAGEGDKHKLAGQMVISPKEEG